MSCHCEQERMVIAERLEELCSGTSHSLSSKCDMKACAIFNDDDKMLKAIIQHIDPRSHELVLSQILDAVEHNSLKCLKILLETYEEDCLSSEPVIEMRHRNRLLNWPIQERAQEYPLHIVASRRSNTDILKYFEKSKNFMKNCVDQPYKNGTTPLLLAVKRKNTEVALFLIKHGAKVDARNNQGDSPITCAALNGLSVVVREMLKDCSPAEKDMLLKDPSHRKEGHTILYWAIKGGDPETIRYLLSLCEEKDSNGLPSLLRMELEHRESGNFICNICASENEYLYDKIVDVYKDLPAKRDDDEATPLMRAAEADSWTMVSKILDSEEGRETIRFHDKKERNVFHYAYKNHNILHDLTQHCTKGIINEKDEENNTALKLAVEGGYIQSFKLLLGYIEKGKEADLFRPPFVGYENLETLKIILSDWKSYNEDAYYDFKNGTGYFQPPLLGAAAKGDVEIMKFLIESGVDGRKCGFDDSTPLHFAAYSGNLQAVKFLLEKFPDMIDCTNDCGQSATGWAAAAGHVKVLRYLLHEKKARITGDCIGGNVLDSAFGNFVKEGVEEALMEIISFCDKNEIGLTIQQVMENSHFGPDYLMAKFVEDVPSVAMEILDRCIETKTALRNGRSGELRTEKNYFYHFYAIKGNTLDGNLKAIWSMIENRQDHCLSHPVVAKFLDKKLTSLQVQFWLNFNLLLYVIFLVSLTGYIGLQTAGSYDLKSPGMQALSMFTLILCLLNCLKELLQAIFDCRGYISDLNNYLEWTMYICTIVYIVTPVGNQKTDHQISAGAIAVFFAWIDFIWFLKRFPCFGIYVIMAKKVFVSIVKVLPLVLLFKIAFAMAFLMLMRGDDGFNSILGSLVTTSVMMIGEIDFRDTFLKYKDNPFSFWQLLFLAIFILTCIILMMNLLIGLAVDDIGGIIRRSKKENQLSKANHVVALEKLFHRIPFLRPPIVEDPLPVCASREEESERMMFKPAKRLKKALIKLGEDGGQSGEDDGEKIRRDQEQLKELSGMQEASEEAVREELNKIQGQLQRLLEVMSANRA